MKEINGALSWAQAGMEVLWSHVPSTAKSYTTMTHLQQFLLLAFLQTLLCCYIPEHAT